MQFKRLLLIGGGSIRAMKIQSPNGEVLKPSIIFAVLMVLIPLLVSYYTLDLKVMSFHILENRCENPNRAQPCLTHTISAPSHIRLRHFSHLPQNLVICWHPSCPYKALLLLALPCYRSSCVRRSLPTITRTSSQRAKWLSPSPAPSDLLH